jgi:DNA-binding CsgD family transcriptional regulator
MKTFWKRLLQRLGFYLPPSQPSLPSFGLNPELEDSIRSLAEQQGRPEEDLAAELLSEALVRRQGAEEQLQRWWELSGREREVAALICHQYTNDQIAKFLKISPLTVKTHVRNLLWKMDASTRTDLIAMLADWDFSPYLISDDKSS